MTLTLLNLQTSVSGDTAVITLSGELAVSGSAQMDAELNRISEDHDPRTIVIDLAQLDFLDSTGLRLVVLADARATAEQRRLLLVRGNDSVHRVFEITRMAERLNFVTSAAEAT